MLAGLGLEPGDEIVTTDRRALRPARAARRVRRDGRRRAARPRRDPRRRHAPDAAHRTSQVLWTTGAVLPLARASRADRRAGARRRSAVGRRDPDDARTGSTSSRSPARSGSAGPTRPARSSSPTPSGSRVVSPSYFAQTSLRAGRELRAAPERAPLRPGLVVARRRSRACSRRSRCAPDWAFERAAAAAPRCRELLAARVELLTPPEPSTLVAFRPERRARRGRSSVSARRGVHVREHPGPGSFARPAAGGRATTTSTGSSRRSR